MERARCLPQINAIKFLGNPAGKMFERQTEATLEVKTRHFETTFEGQKQRYSLLTRQLCVFSHGTLSICRENLFLSSYMPCSVHFVRNRLLTNYILRLAISKLFVSCRGRKRIETSQLFRTQNNSRNSTWNCNFLNMILRNPIYTPTISLKPIKDMQQHAVLPSCAKYLYITERECHVCVTQSRKCNVLQTGS